MKDNWSLEHWLDYIQARHPQNIALGLERITQVAKRLNCLSLETTVITVAGTNGKGSVVACLEHMLVANGYQVASYTSPHLFHYNERIKINGRAVESAELCLAFTQVDNASTDCPLTFFEFTTLAALLLFKQHSLDVCLLEIGLGGRLDCVNIIDPDIAVITGIALDHSDYLGDDLESIANEKAGILRQGIPAVVGTSYLETQNSIKAKIESLGNVSFYSDDYGFTALENRVFVWQDTNMQLFFEKLPELPQRSISIALKVLTLLERQGIELNFPMIEQLLPEISLLGRFTVYDGPVTCIFDVAHNEEAVSHLLNKLADWKQQSTDNSGNTYAVVGMLADKDIESALKQTEGVFSAWFLGTLEGPRGESSHNIANSLSQSFESIENTELYALQNIEEAFQKACSQAVSGDIIVVFGSFHTVAQAMETKLT